MNSQPFTFIACDKEYHEAKIILFGIPFDGTASFRAGTRFAPMAIRHDSHAIESYSPYQDADLLDKNILDIGDFDLPLGNSKRTLDAIEKRVDPLVADNKIPFGIGGEHLVTLPIVRSLIRRYPNMVVLHFDAHTDLRDEYMGESLSHATVIRRIHDLIGDNRIYQFGIRSGLKEEFAFARQHFYIEPFSVKSVEDIVKKLKNIPVYVTLDLDVLDPSVMPGTGTPEAGGLMFNELLHALLPLKELFIVGADVVELSPHYDPSGASTATAVKLIREMLLMIKS